MADISAEPSMEEILSSIKRIIAEEGDGPSGRRRAVARAMVPPPPPEPEDELDDGVLELNDPMPPAPAEPEPVGAAPFDPPPVPSAPPASPRNPDLLVSPAAADATRGALQSLSKLAVRAEPQTDGTLEGVVREMLRPMLREWLDAHLPDLVEAMVAKEIARISGQGR